MTVNIMKFIKILAAAVLLSTFAMGSANAMYLGDVTSSANVRYCVVNGVATLSGNVESAFDRELVERQARKIDGVHRIINLITFSS